VRSIWQYIFLVSERGKTEEAVRRLLQVVAEDEKEEIVSIADQFIEEGRNEGLREGRQQMLLEILRDRFGALRQEVVERIEAADVARLHAWSRRLLTAPTLDDVLRDV
jgi:flagellar biosynthesis/type III secretory pathway protein FliH